MFISSLLSKALETAKGQFVPTQAATEARHLHHPHCQRDFQKRNAANEAELRAKADGARIHKWPKPENVIEGRSMHRGQRRHQTGKKQQWKNEDDWLTFALCWFYLAKFVEDSVLFFIYLLNLWLLRNSLI